MTLVGLAAVIGAASLLNELIKTAVERPRPSAGAFAMTGNSFPSGHVMNGAAMGTAIILLTRQVGWPRWARRIVNIAAIVCITVEAISRLLSNSHWFSDVPPSVLLGYAVTLGAVALGPHLNRRRLVVGVGLYCATYALFFSLPAARLHLPTAAHRQLLPSPVTNSGHGGGPGRGTREPRPVAPSLPSPVARIGHGGGGSWGAPLHRVE
jgi:hypothetical protein